MFIVLEDTNAEVLTPFQLVVPVKYLKQRGKYIYNIF
jgi:hypothetical protein